MVSLEHYVGREQSYVKHVFLESYLERLVHKVASRYSHVVYVDGFAGPWQSANEQFEDTSFGIALNALRRAKASWKEQHRDVQMTAYLVERDEDSYKQLATIQSPFPDITVRTYNEDFLTVLPEILKDIPGDAFAFFLLDPKGWRIPLKKMEGLLQRQHSEVIFNFMFEFINRAVSIKDAQIEAGLNELIPVGDWKLGLQDAEPARRKTIIVNAFAQSLKTLGNYDYVAETTVLRSVKDRPLYCLFYATRHPKGIEVFRDCQIAALREESKTRAATKIKHAISESGQSEMFDSLHDMALDKLESFLTSECTDAERTLLLLVPKAPSYIRYENLQAQVMARHVIRFTDVNKIATRLYKEKKLLFPDWEAGKRKPQPDYRTQRP
jgi:three-Cys-motif partner protein